MSPTLTAKSRAVPGVAGLMRPPTSLSGLGVSEQAASARAIRMAPHKPTPALRHLESSILRPLPPAQFKPRAAGTTAVVLPEASFKNVTAAHRGKTDGLANGNLASAVFPTLHAKWRAGRGVQKIRAAPSMQP